MKKQVESWLKAAYDDLLVIKEIINKKNLTHMVAFHSQQSIEKSIKSILEDKGSEIPKIHKLIVLKEKIKTYIDLEINQDVFDELNDFYIESRYPTNTGILPDDKPTEKNAKKIL